MASESDVATHRPFAVRFFNEAWTYIEKPERTPADDLRMIHLTHASRMHWEYAGDDRNRSIGEWQISRVYAVVGRAEPALYHAQRALEYANGLDPFVIGFAHEAMARAFALIGDADAARSHLARARYAADDVQDERDRKLLLDDLATIEESD